MAKRIADTEGGHAGPPQQVRPYLSFQGEGDRTITGVGLFRGKGVDPLPVSDSIAHQYETDEQKDLGWVVEWKEGAQRIVPVQEEDAIEKTES